MTPRPEIRLCRNGSPSRLFRRDEIIYSDPKQITELEPRRAFTFCVGLLLASIGAVTVMDYGA